MFVNNNANTTNNHHHTSRVVTDQKYKYLHQQNLINNNNNSNNSDMSKTRYATPSVVYNTQANLHHHHNHQHLHHQPQLQTQPYLINNNNNSNNNHQNQYIHHQHSQLSHSHLHHQQQHPHHIQQIHSNQYQQSPQAYHQLTSINNNSSINNNVTSNNFIKNQNSILSRKKSFESNNNKHISSNTQHNQPVPQQQQQQQQKRITNTNKKMTSQTHNEIAEEPPSIQSIESIVEFEFDNNNQTNNNSNQNDNSGNLSISNSFNEFNEIDDDDQSQDFSLEKSTNDDLVTLNNLNESTVLEQLKKRFSKNQIYTYIGDILIAMNPLKALSIYGKKVSNYYKACENFRGKLPPHIYATAEQCFREMIRTQQSQCILISGESGSGKTETCKYLVQHLLNRTKPFESSLNAKIQEVNPLLEAFGNAKTRINDNSSRFGKYLEIYFEEDGTVVGAKFKEYLLEKSRVVYQNEYESTFHIFYLLFAGLTAEEKLRYGLLRSPKKFRFMSNTNVDNCLSTENEEKFFAIKKSLNTIGFINEDIENLLKVLISVLLIGEIQFAQKKGNNNDAVQVKNMEIVSNFCDLLEMEPSELNEALVSDVQITRGEEIKRERNMVQACDVRDALAKAFYGRLFSWIVNQINHHIQPAEGVISSFSIGLLDIFGFENFEKNSFEQMCINLANEQLHQIFTKYIFKLEIQECLDEQIELNNSDLITYQDNQIILDLFLEKRMGIFALLDEESRFPKATDQSLAIKLHQTLTPLYSDVYVAPKNVGTSFHIVHYAGQVLYSVEGFLEKNRDFLPNNLFYAARNSNNFLVQELFQCKLTRKGTIAPSDRQSRLRKSMHNSFNTSIPPRKDNKTINNNFNTNNTSNHHQTSDIHKVKFSGVNSTSSSSTSNIYNNINFYGSNNGKEEFRNSVNSHTNNQYSSDKALPLTVACHFKNSLHELIEKITKCKAYFIRCIKPNPNQENVFLNEFVTKQLRYCSLMHVCKIRKCGYPYRIKFEEFLKWYKAIEICILKKEETIKNNNNLESRRDHNNNVDDNLQKCLKCLEYAKITNYKVGKTKLFLRYWHIDIFNSLAKKLETNVLIAQKVIRGWLVRNRLKKMQQNEINKFANQISTTSTNLFNKLNAQKSFVFIPKILKSSDEETSSADSSKDNSPNNTKIIKDTSKLGIMNDNQNGSQSSWPDLNEINNALEEFDSMLEEFEIKMGPNDNKNRYQPNQANHTNQRPGLQIKNNPQLTRSASSFITNNLNNKISPTSVYHLVNNNNNKNDNTLKKRNALVAFEFKTLLDKVVPQSPSPPPAFPTNLMLDEDKLISEEISNALPSPPFIYNDDQVFDLNHNHSPPSYSSSSSPTSSSSSASNSSSSPHERTVSPSQLTRSARFVSPPRNTTTIMITNTPVNNNHNYVNVNVNNNMITNGNLNNNNQKYLLTELNTNDNINNRNLAPHLINLKSKSQVLANNKNEEIQKTHIIINERDIQNQFVLSNSHFVKENKNPNIPNQHQIQNLNQNHAHVTIWREELNAKNNVQEQIKKQTELCQKIEDSKKNIPEWKKNLIKQKEMKRITSTNNNNSNNNQNNSISSSINNSQPETPELMKHNIFIKKGLATHK